MVTLSAPEIAFQERSLFLEPEVLEVTTKASLAQVRPRGLD
jgi:hypothetical protein